jgi:hypothetical protein
MWTEFRTAEYPPDVQARLKEAGLMPDQVYRNNLYEVQVRLVRPYQDDGETMVWLSIKRIDREPIDQDHWRILQKIKNQILGPECEGVELFPAESRLVDTSNQYHLFCHPDPGARFPFGFNERLVMEKPMYGAKQRPWSDADRPSDLSDGPANQAIAAIMGVKP